MYILYSEFKNSTVATYNADYCTTTYDSKQATIATVQWTNRTFTFKQMKNPQDKFCCSIEPHNKTLLNYYPRGTYSTVTKRHKDYKQYFVNVPMNVRVLIRPILHNTLSSTRKEYKYYDLARYQI